MLPARPTELSTMFVDMDAFFASVEQQHRPEARNRPVGVCPCLGEGCAVIASSYEAKRLGIRVGTRVAEARRICPDIVLLRDRPYLYRQASQQIMHILDDTICQIFPKSIDEAYMIVPSYARSMDQINALCKAIKGNISDVLGEYVRCSIGIGPNIWLAKMAAAVNKPNGMCVVHCDDLSEFYAGLNLLKLTGINRRMARRLHSIGIYSVKDLYAASLSLLTRHFGVVGQKWYLRLRGYEVDREVTNRPPQSLGHQTTILGESLHDQAAVYTVLTKLASKVGYRLRRQGLMAQGVVLWLSNDSWQGWSQIARHMLRMGSDADILDAAKKLLVMYQGELAVRRIGITVFDLIDDRQLGLFDAVHDDRLQISRAIDQLANRFGTASVQRASWLGQEIVPDRVGFGRPHI